MVTQTVIAIATAIETVAVIGDLLPRHGPVRQPLLSHPVQTRAKQLNHYLP